jgi:hypothetical protein
MTDDTNNFSVKFPVAEAAELNRLIHVCNWLYIYI